MNKSKRSFRRYYTLIAISLSFTTIAGGCTTIPAGPSNTVYYTSFDEQVVTHARDELTLISLNLAHGRKQSFSQLLLTEQTIRDNLGDIAQYLTTHQPDIVALQEADGPSTWSGNFDHVEFLAKQSDFSFAVRTEHVDNIFGRYGTAILSRLPIYEHQGITFSPSPPTTQKGFTLSTIQWQIPDRREHILIDVVSLHLDFLSQSIRKQQVAEIKAVLKDRDNPLIIMGDFNSEDIARHYLPAHLAEQRGLQIFHLADQLGGSFGDKRLDWVILSKEFIFLEYHIEDVALSDHRPILVRIGYSNGEARPATATKIQINNPQTPITANSGALDEA